MDATAFVEKNPRTKQVQQIKGVEAGMQTLAWVTMAPKPAPYIKEMIGSAQFYTNRVLKDFKDKDEQQVAWARSHGALLNALHDYVKEFHTTGPSWNAAGGAATVPAPPASTPAVASTKPAVSVSAKPAADAGGDVKGALFSALAKGEGVTSGLKKVDRSQMTHKNPELRASSVVKASDVKSTPVVATSAPKLGAAARKQDPVLELQGKKWVVVGFNFFLYLACALAFRREG